MSEKDKKRIVIGDLLKANHDGLTIQEVMDKTGLARHTVLARLHRLEGEKKVRMRQVNMAKMYYWNEEPEFNLGIEPHEITKDNLKLTELKETHITKSSKQRSNEDKPEGKFIDKPFDMTAVKEEIEKQLKGKQINKTEAQIKEQR